MFTLTETEPDTETAKEIACMKLYGTVHTDRDPLTLEFMESVSVFESGFVNEPSRGICAERKRTFDFYFYRQQISTAS